LHNQIEEDAIGGAYNTPGRDDKCIQNFIINIEINVTEIWYENADWVRLVQNKDPWQTIVTMVTNFRVP
jgi:hypothetical protein